MLDTDLAKLSNNFINATTVVYALAMFGYAADLAFGAGFRGRRAGAAADSVSLAEAPAALAERPAVLVGGGSVAASSEAGSGRPLAVAGAGVGDGSDTVATGATATSGPSGTSNRALPERFGRIAVALTVLGVLLHAGAIATRGLSAHRLPWGNMYEFAMALTFSGVAAYLVILTRQKIRYLGLFVLLPVLLGLGIAIKYLYVPSAPLVPALQSYWIAIHVTAAIIASGVFYVGAAASVLFIVADRHEKRVLAGQPTGRARLANKLPVPATLDKIAYRSIVFAFPLWTFAVIAGSLWADEAWGKYWQWDPKETWSFITWVVFAGYLHARATVGWRGRRAAYIAVIGFSTFLFNYFWVNILGSGLHSYSGLS